MFFNYSKGITPIEYVNRRGGCARVRTGVYGKCPYFPFNFPVNLKPLSKKQNLLKIFYRTVHTFKKLLHVSFIYNWERSKKGRRKER